MRLPGRERRDRTAAIEVRLVERVRMKAPQVAYG